MGLLLSLHLALSPVAVEVIETLTQQITIPVVIASFAFFSQFRFADVFVKRSLTLLAAVLLTVLHATLIVAPVARVIRSRAPHAEAAAWLAAIILWCALLLVFPLCVRALNRAADRWLFQRPDYRHLANRFARQLEAVTEEAQLFAQTAQCIRAALDAAEVRVLARAEWQALGVTFEPADEIITLPTGHVARNSPSAPEVTTLLPIRERDGVTRLLTIAPGERGRRLLSDELAFLTTLAERVGRKLEALRFERERQAQQLREARWQQLLTEAELKALRAQVNPHFLFNTLNTIADLIGSEPEQAEAMTERLAEVFRYVLARTEGALIAVREEFDFLRTYLEIEQARFGTRLQVEITVDPPAAALLIPPLLLQPLAENAIKHGLAPRLTGGWLRLRAIDEGARLRLLVEDDGLGWRQPDKPTSACCQSSGGTGGGIGLKNVTERLQILYGARASLDICSAPGAGTQISISIPKDETQNFDQR
ncbi:MAG: histidine kinase [Blastocatellia bacterium]